MIYNPNGSLPQGRARCHPCRRGERIKPRIRRCTWCGDKTTHGKLCSSACSNQASSRHVLSSDQRGYGYRHRMIRLNALTLMVDGDPCARCGEPMHKSDRLDLDHTDDRGGYLGLSHYRCNRAKRPAPQINRRTSTHCEVCRASLTTKQRNNGNRTCGRVCGATLRYAAA